MLSVPQLNRPMFVTWARNRIRRGYCPIVLVTGEQRSGKTCLALRFAYDLDPDFNPDEQLFFKVIDFAKAVMTKTRKVLVLDEAGIELDRFRYADARARCFSHVVQTQAYKQNTLFIVLPHNSDIAKCHKPYIKMLLVVRGHGHYKAYIPTTRYWDMNDMIITTKMIEEVYDVPLPPEYIYTAYKERYEKQIKEDILKGEISKLENVLAPKTKVDDYKPPNWDALNNTMTTTSQV